MLHLVIPPPDGYYFKKILRQLMNTYFPLQALITNTCEWNYLIANNCVYYYNTIKVEKVSQTSRFEHLFIRILLSMKAIVLLVTGGAS